VLELAVADATLGMKAKSFHQFLGAMNRAPQDPHEMITHADLVRFRPAHGHLHSTSVATASSADGVWIQPGQELTEVVLSRAHGTGGKANWRLTVKLDT